MSWRYTSRTSERGAGTLSFGESLETLRTKRVSDEMAKILADGFGVLVEVLKVMGAPKVEH